MRTARQRAREAYAIALEGQGPAYRNMANSIRAGFENIWIMPALTALEAMLRLVPDDAEADDTEAGRG